jgi:hypothetical protein
MKKMKGLTIIQLMVLLFFVGIVGSIVVNLIIDKRCEDNPKTELCISRARK